MSKLLDLFERDFAAKLFHREDTYRKIIGLLPDRELLIVETGTTRQPGNFKYDGNSTVIWDSLTGVSGGRVFSVDLDPEAVVAARGLVSTRTTVVEENSLTFLAKFPEKENIDLLYLDSLDAHLPEAPAHHLFELMQVWSSLRPGTIVAIDDVLEPHRGKHAAVAHFMHTMGIEAKVWGYQVAWVKP